VFTEDLNRIVGQSLNEVEIFHVGFLKDPTEIVILPNQNKRYRYDHKHAEINGSGECTVFIELDVNSETILNATSGGLGCWRIY